MPDRRGQPAATPSPSQKAEFSRRSELRNATETVITRTRRWARNQRQSIPPTYDHRETGDRFTVETRLNDRRVSLTPMRDPFMHHRVTVGWRDLLRGLLRRQLVVTVIVGGESEIVEDVCELDADYAGRFGSTRREEWRARIEGALRRV